MSYYNQTDHPFLDRKLIRDLLVELISAEVRVSPTSEPRAEQLANLLKMAASSLEREWLQFIEAHDYRLPTQAQPFIASCKTRPDFLYGEGHQAAIYVDGPHHEFPERQQRDALQSESMEDYGYTVIRFGLRESWHDIVRQFPSVFGPGKRSETDVELSAKSAAQPSIDLDLFDPKWHPLLKELVERQSATIKPGEDVHYGGEIIGSFVAEITIDGKSVRLVDDSDPGASNICSVLKEQGDAAVAIGAQDVKAGLAAIAAMAG
jgi:very-short-patch-repair endonuclease